MSDPKEHPSEVERLPVRGAWFPTTRWNLVLTATAAAEPDADEALNRLCATYWHPVFTYVRRQGHEVADAQDLTQAFFVHLLEGSRMHSVAPHKGKFRSFLIASLRNFLVNDWDRRQTLKRGGGCIFLSLEAGWRDHRDLPEPAHRLAPDQAFDQSWALTLLEVVFSRLRQEQGDGEKARQFEALQRCLSGDRDGVPYTELATRLGLSESGVKMAVLRLRRRFGELLREEVSCTVSGVGEVDEEIRALFAAVRG